MNISLWRSGLRSWITANIPVDTWDLRNPVTYNTWNVFTPPLRSIIHNSDQLGTVEAEQDIYLTIRYTGETRYQDLPIGNLEQLYVTVLYKLQHEWASIAPLLEFQTLSLVDGIHIQEYGDELADWLVTLAFSVKLAWVAEPTLIPGGTPPLTPNTGKLDITGGLFTVLSSTNVPPGNPKDRVGDIKS